MELNIIPSRGPNHLIAEEVKGEINGKPYQGIVYSAMNDKGEKVGNPVKASRTYLFNVTFGF